MLTGKGNDKSDKHEEQIENLGSQTNIGGPLDLGLWMGQAGHQPPIPITSRRYPASCGWELGHLMGKSMLKEPL